MYRVSSVDSRARCATHPAAPAIDLCVGCGAAVCEPCGLYYGLHLRCPRCVLDERRRRRLRRLVSTTFGLGTIAFVLVFGVLASQRLQRIRPQPATHLPWTRVQDPSELVAIEQRVDREYHCTRAAFYRAAFDFQAAANEYGAVLALDPDNDEAKRGLNSLFGEICKPP